MDGRRATLVFLPVFFASGFAALAYQIVWQRLLAFFSGADVFSVTLIVSAFMAGLGLGSLAGGHLADRLSPARRVLAFALAEAAIAAFALVSVPLLYDVLYVGLAPRALPLVLVGSVLFAVLLWPTFFMGLSLPLLARALTETPAASARRIGSLYGWNTLGAAVGALVTVFVVVRLHGFAAAIGVGAFLNLACAVTALLALRWLRFDGAPPAPADAPPPAAGAPSRGPPHLRALAACSTRSPGSWPSPWRSSGSGCWASSSSPTPSRSPGSSPSTSRGWAWARSSDAPRRRAPHIRGAGSWCCRCWSRPTPACPSPPSSTASTRGRGSPGSVPISASTKRSTSTPRAARSCATCSGSGTWRRSRRTWPPSSCGSTWSSPWCSSASPRS